MSKKYPVYITRYEIDQSDLNEFIEGIISPEHIDPTGNQIIKTNSDSIENCLLSLNQTRTEFSKDKIEQNYDTTFSEFVDTQDKNENANDQINMTDDISEIETAHKKQESIMSNQLDELTKILETESQKNIKFQEDAEQNYLATKNLIIDMRIKNGEGNSTEDFSDAFPFTPKTNKNSSDTDYNPLPFVSEP
jgi:hypothetical protein